MSSTNWLAQAESANLTINNVINNVINGELIPVSPANDATGNFIDKCSPRDGRLLYRIHEGSADDVDQAVKAARAAYNSGVWSQMPVGNRAAVLNRLADLLEKHHDSLMLNECLDVGKTVATSLKGEISRSTGRLRGAASLAPKLEVRASCELGELSYHRRKPVGVVGAICGWNYPLAMACGKVAPALVMGNSLVLKPSEFTSLSTWRLAELALEAGVPPGVLNIVNGAGATVGDALARHMDVDLLSFVGGTVTGRRVMVAAGESNMKRLILECGGKSPYLVFDDCPDDLDALADDIVGRAFPNQGALCVASSRLLIQDSMRERLLPLVLAKAAALKPGDPLDPQTNFGALVNEGHMNKVLGYIDTAKQQGAELLLGGERVFPDGAPALKNGFYIPPTIFDRVSPKDTIAQEEIFGPVLAIQTFSTEEEAISLANNTDYGLASYAATTNLGRAQRLAAAISSGSLTVFATNTPSGGGAALSSDKHKQSGFGSTGGVDGLAAYSITTSVGLYT